MGPRTSADGSSKLSLNQSGGGRNNCSFIDECRRSIDIDDITIQFDGQSGYGII